MKRRTDDIESRSNKRDAGCNSGCDTFNGGEVEILRAFKEPLVSDFVFSLRESSRATEIPWVVAIQVATPSIVEKSKLLGISKNSHR
ncbi:hypothetical protein VNO78_27035 [Psophocarpus tetragonolobus]|uniref:Uncharacterized protein n=1 Tax=Psophocarpus tetragonolobus TaxID=3891 RepID=A0AAN9X9U7_PSOTE